MKLKKFLGIALTIVIVLCSLLALASCGDPEECVHEYGEWKTTKQSTCVEAGERVQICTKCTSAKVESVDATGHSAVHHEASNASCLEGGHIEYWHCQSCDKLYSDSACTAEFSSVNIPAAGHTINHYDKKEPTCVLDGNVEYWECTACSKLFKDASLKAEFASKDETVISKTGHALTYTEAIPATCTKKGQAEYWSCETCNKSYKDEACTEEVTTLGDLATGVTNHSYTLYIIHERHWEICNDCSAIKEGSSVSHTEGESCSSCGYQSGLEFKEYYGYATIIGGKSLSGKVIIPVSYNGSPVTEIEDGAFQNNTRLKEIVIPEGITKIGDNVFNGCYNLERVNGESSGDIILPNTLTSLGNNAFYNVTHAKNVYVGNNVTSIGSSCFYHCLAIESITLPFVGSSASATSYKAVFGYIFGYTTKSGSNRDSYSTAFLNQKIGEVAGAIWQFSCYNHNSGSYYYENGYHYYIPTTIRNVTITNQSKLPDGAFNGCYFIESINIPESTTLIGNGAFQDCTNLSSINSTTSGEFNIPVSVSAINDYTFKGCESLEAITTGVIFKLGKYSLANCYSLTSVNVPKDKKEIGTYAFYKCTALESISLGEISTIGDYAFYYCENLKCFNSDKQNTILIPDGATSIGSYALSYLGEIKEICVPESVTSIGIGAFKSSFALESITLPFVGSSASATSYESVFGYIFGYTAKSGTNRDSRSTAFLNKKVGDVAGAIWQFSCYDYYSGSYYYENGYHYYIPTTIRNVTITNQSKLPDGAFNGCYFIESINIPESTTMIGIAAFQDCRNLKTINSNVNGEYNIPANVTTISDYTFSSCIFLEKLNVNTIIKIGTRAMQYCSNLKNVSIASDDTKTLGAYAFNRCSSLVNLSIGKISEIGEYCFMNCVQLSSLNSEAEGTLSLPAGLTTIGNYAFNGVSSIKEAVVPDSVTSIGAGAFYRCNSIESIALPFVGSSASATSYESVFGYIFGYTAKSGSNRDSRSTAFLNKKVGEVADAIWQFSCYDHYSGSYYYENGYHYYIPTTIRNVTITNQASIPVAAFNGCYFIESITLQEDATLGDYATQDCPAIIEYKPKES